ncbi:MAG: DNA cytosine methyltransferase [SAR324 cluster bacterium]|nr:DNA cytosine methyltransferase [SAR324 cluster bacterium]
MPGNCIQRKASESTWSKRPTHSIPPPSIFACEIDEGLAGLYQMNFDLLPDGDIRTLEIATIPSHDILRAGCGNNVSD